MRYFLRRPRAFWISVCNLFGLAFSMVGVVLLFMFALPTEVPNSPTVTTIDPRMNVPEYLAVVRRYNGCAYIGPALVLLGTVLEAVPPLCTARGS